MKERNKSNELLNNFSGIKRKAMIKALLYVVLLAIIMLISLISLWKAGISSERIICGGISYLLILIIVFFAFKKIYKDEEKMKLNIALVEKCLSVQEHTEVKPIDIDAFKKEMLSIADAYTEILPLKNEEAEEYKNYITSLLETVKFYARISETEKDLVEIFVKYDNEEKLRYYKAIDKAIFLDEYSIQEEDEQEEK